MKTQRMIMTATVLAVFSLGLGMAYVSRAATSHAPAARVPAAAQQTNLRIQQALQQELEQRLQARNTTIAKVHHEFALKDAEIRRMHVVIAHKDAVIKHLRAQLGQTGR